MLALLCAGCGTVTPLPRGPEAYAVIPVEPPRAEGTYEIGVNDTLSVTVLDEPQLSAQDLRVDPGGSISLPSVGMVRVAGLTPAQVSDVVTSRLARYLKRPAVAVNVNSVSQTFAVEGQVNRPGIFDLRGNMSLLDAMSAAQSPTRIAALDQVIVFRDIDGRRAGAVFDLSRIRAGIDPDPAIMAGDRVVVGFSAVKGAWVDFLSATPLINVFRYF